VDARPTRADELHHLADWSGASTWHETFRLDFVAPDASVAGYVLVVLRPGEERAWYWACLTGRDRRLVLVEETDAPLPRRPLLELRASGLWCDIECEIPGEHVSVGLEAFGLAFDDHADAAARRGERTPVGFDLEWETSGAVEPWGERGYAMPCRVTGEVLVGDEQLPLDASGGRAHRWGDDPWWQVVTSDREQTEGEQAHGERVDGEPAHDALVRVAVELPDHSAGRRMLRSSVHGGEHPSWRHVVA
jgi:hypothetical protein